MFTTAPNISKMLITAPISRKVQFDGFSPSSFNIGKLSPYTSKNGVLSPNKFLISGI